MRLIRIAQGTMACREEPDEVAPPWMPPLQDMVLGVQQRYQFVSIPGFPNAPRGTPIVFQNGKFEIGDQVHAIPQLAMEAVGDVVSTSDTQIADKFIDDLFEYLDNNFGYKLRSKNQKRSYVSSLIVEFEISFEEKINAVTYVNELVNRMRGPNAAPFGLRKFSFAGNPPPSTSSNSSHVVLIEEAEFFIERRSGSLLDTNTYFCSAPLRTIDHIKCLEEIERFLTSL